MSTKMLLIQKTKQDWSWSLNQDSLKKVWRRGHTWTPSLDGEDKPDTDEPTKDILNQSKGQDVLRACSSTPEQVATIYLTATKDKDDLPE